MPAPAPAPSDPRRLARQLKRASAVLAAIVFGGFWALAAGHQVGVTNASSASGTSTPAAQVRQVNAAPSTSQSSRQSSRPARRSLSNGGSSAPVLSSGSS